MLLLLLLNVNVSKAVDAFAVDALGPSVSVFRMVRLEVAVLEAVMLEPDRELDDAATSPVVCPVMVMLENVTLQADMLLVENCVDVDVLAGPTVRMFDALAVPKTS